MRIREKIEITLSKDTLNEPKEIRFSCDNTLIDVVSLKEYVSRCEVFPIGSSPIALNNIALGKYLLIIPSVDLGVSINGNPDITFAADKLSRIWADIVTLVITVPGSTAAQVQVLIAGE